MAPTPASGEHVLDEPLVARYINEADVNAFDIGPREAKVDGETPSLFLSPPIGISASECFDKRRLAVVDVACGANNRHVREAVPGSRSRYGRRRREVQIEDR